MTENFYDKVYFGKADGEIKKIPDNLVRENTFYKKLLCPVTGTKLLDVGCGCGNYLAMLSDTGADLWGIDISEHAVSLARRRLNKPDRIMCANADPLPFSDGEFDYVTAWGVIEHFPNILSILKEIHRVTKDSGTIGISVPNVYYYKFVWDTIRKGSGPVKHQEIEVLYSFKEWKDLIESVGLVVVKTACHNKFHRPLFSIWVRNIIIPFYLSNHFVFVCKKLK